MMVAMEASRGEKCEEWKIPEQTMAVQTADVTTTPANLARRDYDEKVENREASWSEASTWTC